MLSFQVLIDPDTLMIFGGGTDGTSQEKKVYSYKLSTRTWTEKAPMAEARSMMVCGMIRGNRVLVAGGFAGTALSSVEIYNIATNTWTAGKLL